MRSIYSHLQSTKGIGEDVISTQKPVFRSSAIFPILHNQYYSSKILFMGYWLLKRSISQIGLLYTLRDLHGTILSRKYLLIDSPRAYAIGFTEFINEIKDKTDVNDFVGSLELEIFSVIDLVFPYPAFVLTYYGSNFSTAVHTVGRIYNDIEDLAANEEYRVKESGFDIYGSDNIEPFMAFTNGSSKNDLPVITYKVKSLNGNEIEGSLKLNSIKPYETVFIKFNEHINLKQVLGDSPGTITVGHNFEGFFPRFVVGNFEKKSKAISITHSYYDSSEINDSKAFWNRKDGNFYDSSVLIPLFIQDTFYTSVVVYPIFSPSNFTMSFDFFDENGKITGQIKNHVLIKSADGRYAILDFQRIIKENNFSYETTKAVNIICNWDDKDKIPTRLKFGLNVGMKNNQVQLPCNICFAPLLGNPNVLKKKSTFKWAPVINKGESVLVLTNSSSLREYTWDAKVQLNFYRESDNSTLERVINIPPNGLKILKVAEDDELKLFLADGSGWLTAYSENPFLNGWYFDFSNQGSVAADHFF